jgi:tetratricopeptide (TPR) repeat protein
VSLERRRTIIVGFVALIAYAGAVPNGFAFDDRPVLLESPIMRGLAPISSALIRDWWGQLAAQTIGSYRPFAVVSLWIDWQLSGGRPWPIHLVNVLLHAGAMMLVYRVFRRIVPDTVAFAGALFAAVFAAPAEAVEGLVGRADLVETIGLVGGLWAHRRLGIRAGLLAALGLLLALGTKETGIIAPAAWIAFDVLIPPAESPWQKRLGRFAGYAAVLTLYLLLRWRAIGTLQLPHTQNVLYNPLLTATFSGRLFGAGRIFVQRYLAGMLDPRRRLYDCSAQACTSSGPDDWVAWTGVLLFVLFLTLPVLLRRRSPPAAAGVAWFVVFFAPVSNFLVPATLTYGERLLYVPSIGLGMAIGAGICALAAAHATAAWSGFAALLLVNATSLQWRHRDWKSNATLATSALRWGADSVVVQGNNASAAIDRKDFVGAERFARRAVELYASDPYAHKVLAVALHGQGREQQAEAEFRQALALERRSDLVADFANFLALQRRYDEALEWVRQQRLRDPEDDRLGDLQRRLEKAQAREARSAP